MKYLYPNNQSEKSSNRLNLPSRNIESALEPIRRQRMENYSFDKNGSRSGRCRIFNNNARNRRRQALVDIQSRINSIGPKEKALSHSETKTTITTSNGKALRHHCRDNPSLNNNKTTKTVSSKDASEVLLGGIPTSNRIVEPRATTRIELNERHHSTIEPRYSHEKHTQSSSSHQSPSTLLLCQNSNQQTNTRKEAPNTPVAEKPLDVADRIERSRRFDKFEDRFLNLTNGDLLRPDNGITAHKGRITGRVDLLDRIECTRQEDCTTYGVSNSTIDRPTSIRFVKDAECDLSLSQRTCCEELRIVDNSIGEGEGQKLTWDSRLIKSYKENRHKNDSQNEYRSRIGTEIAPRKDLQKLQKTLSTQPLPQKQGRGQSQSLPIEYSDCIHSLVVKTDTAEPSSKLHDFAKRNKNRATVVIRTRALLDHEVQRGDCSAIKIPRESLRTLTLYEKDASNTCIQKQDRSSTMNCWKAHVIKFDAVFSERSSFEEFYTRSVEKNVQDALSGGMGVVILFGNDEFGKSHTMSGIEERVALDLFPEEFSTKLPVRRRYSVSLTCLGLGRPPCNNNSSTNSNDLCIDLLSPVHHFVEIIESTNRNDNIKNYQAYGATEVNVFSATEFLEVMTSAKQSLASERILRRESESSSYFLCQISIRKNATTSTAEPPQGILWLVLCPSGDEVCYWTDKMNHNESICGNRDPTITNTGNPLANLMETVQNHSISNSILQQHQCCNLTRLLGQSIVARKQATEISLVGSVSPSTRDTDASLLTMLSAREYMTRFQSTVSSKEINESGVNREVEESRRLVLPRQWSKEQLMEWLLKKKFIGEAGAAVTVANRNSSTGGETMEVSGKTIMTMTKAQLEDCFFRSDNDGHRRANKLFVALRAENDRIARLRVKRKFAFSKQQTKQTNS